METLIETFNISTIPEIYVGNIACFLRTNQLKCHTFPVYMDVIHTYRLHLINCIISFQYKIFFKQTKFFYRCKLMVTLKNKISAKSFSSANESIPNLMMIIYYI